MTRKIILTLSSVFVLATANAQIKSSDSLQSNLKTEGEYEEGWNSNGSVNIGFAQSHLTNWGAGGELNAMNVNGLISGYKTKKQDRALWENTYYASYGLNFLESNNFKPRKTDDRLDLASKYGIQMKNKDKWYWAGMGRLQTQFSKGYDYSDSLWKSNPDSAMKNPISQLFSPAYITVALGIEYKPNTNFNWFFSPAAARFTFVNSRYTQDGDRFGVAKGNTSRLELGAYSTLNWVKQLATNINYRTRLDLYMDYLDPKGFGLVDILWDNTMSFKVNKYMGMSFGLTMFYDNDQPGRKKPDGSNYGLGWWQMKEIFNMGLAYQFN